LRSKTGRPVERGDLLVVRTGGGGGYGPPEERPSALADRDRDLGLSSEKRRWKNRFGASDKPPSTHPYFRVSDGK